MKRMAPICLAVLSACSGGGRGHDHPPEGRSVDVDKVVFDFQSGFDHTPVELLLDGQLLFSAVLTTDERVGLARSIKLPARHPLPITVVIILNQGAQYSYRIQLDLGRYIGFSKNLDSGKLQMEQRHHPFEYD